MLLSLVPVVAGGFRLSEVTGGAAVTPDNARFLASPLPVAVHIVGAALFALLGAFQFSGFIRRVAPAWHRRAGRVVAAAGLAVAISGLWMSQAYPPPSSDNGLTWAFRLAFGLGMLASIGLGVAAIVRRDIVRHSAWMLRGYAIGMGAGTQVLTLAPYAALAGEPDATTRALLMGLAWVINLGVAEWIIRGRPSPLRRRAAAA